MNHACETTDDLAIEKMHQINTTMNTRIFPKNRDIHGMNFNATS